MPRIRSIKPDFWDSADTASASLRVRLLYIAMWNWADDYGIGDATPLRLIAFAFPNDDIPAADYPTLMSDVRGAFGVVYFEHGGRRYYAIPEWEKHQRTEKKAKPKEGLLEAAQAAIDADQPPNADPPTNTADSPTPSDGDSGAGNGKSEVGNGKSEVELAPQAAAPTTDRKRGTRIPDGWEPDEDVIRSMREERPDVDLRTEHRKFVDHFKAKAGKDGVKLDWNATWRNWIRNARSSPNMPSVVPSAADTKVNDWLALANNQTPHLKAIGE